MYCSRWNQTTDPAVDRWLPHQLCHSCPFLSVCVYTVGGEKNKSVAVQLSFFIRSPPVIVLYFCVELVCFFLQFYCTAFYCTPRLHLIFFFFHFSATLEFTFGINEVSICLGSMIEVKFRHTIDVSEILLLLSANLHFCYVMFGSLIHRFCAVARGHSAKGQHCKYSVISIKGSYREIWSRCSGRRH